MTPQSCLLTPQLQALLGAVAASALKLDFAALQPRCACSLRLLAAMSCRLRRCCLQWCKCCGHFTRGCDAGVQSLNHSTLQSTSNILATAQGLPLEQGGSASQAVTALAAEVRENVKLRQIRWCVCESRLHRLLGSAFATLVLGWLAPTSSSVHMPTAVLLVLPAESVAWWRFTQPVR